MKKMCAPLMFFLLLALVSASQPKCSNTDRTQPNNSPCKCGSVTCSASKSYCKKGKNRKKGKCYNDLKSSAPRQKKKAKKKSLCEPFKMLATPDQNRKQCHFTNATCNSGEACFGVVGGEPCSEGNVNHGCQCMELCQTFINNYTRTNITHPCEIVPTSALSEKNTVLENVACSAKIPAGFRCCQRMSNATENCSALCDGPDDDDTLLPNPERCIAKSLKIPRNFTRCRVAADRTFEEAEAACQAQGMTLCKPSTFKDGICKGTGCQHDYRRVWVFSEKCTDCIREDCMCGTNREPCTGNTICHTTKDGKGSCVLPCTDDKKEDCSCGKNHDLCAGNAICHIENDDSGLCVLPTTTTTSTTTTTTSTTTTTAATNPCQAPDLDSKNVETTGASNLSYGSFSVTLKCQRGYSGSPGTASECASPGTPYTISGSSCAEACVQNNEQATGAVCACGTSENCTGAQYCYEATLGNGASCHDRPNIWATDARDSTAAMNVLSSYWWIFVAVAFELVACALCFLACTRKRTRKEEKNYPHSSEKEPNDRQSRGSSRMSELSDISVLSV